METRSDRDEGSECGEREKNPATTRQGQCLNSTGETVETD